MTVLRFKPRGEGGSGRCLRQAWGVWAGPAYGSRDLCPHGAIVEDQLPLGMMFWMLSGDAVRLESKSGPTTSLALLVSWQKPLPAARLTGAVLAGGDRPRGQVEEDVTRIAVTVSAGHRLPVHPPDFCQQPECQGELLHL